MPGKPLAGGRVSRAGHAFGESNRRLVANASVIKYQPCCPWLPAAQPAEFSRKFGPQLLRAAGSTTEQLIGLSPTSATLAAAAAKIEADRQQLDALQVELEAALHAVTTLKSTAPEELQPQKQQHQQLGSRFDSIGASLRMFRSKLQTLASTAGRLANPPRPQPSTQERLLATFAVVSVRTPCASLSVGAGGGAAVGADEWPCSRGVSGAWTIRTGEDLDRHLGCQGAAEATADMLLDLAEGRRRLIGAVMAASAEELLRGRNRSHKVARPGGGGAVATAATTAAAASAAGTAVAGAAPACYSPGTADRVSQGRQQFEPSTQPPRPAAAPASLSASGPRSPGGAEPVAQPPDHHLADSEQVTGEAVRAALRVYDEASRSDAGALSTVELAALALDVVRQCAAAAVAAEAALIVDAEVRTTPYTDLSHLHIGDHGGGTGAAAVLAALPSALAVAADAAVNLAPTDLSPASSAGSADGAQGRVASANGLTASSALSALPHLANHPRAWDGTALIRPSGFSMSHHSQPQPQAEAQAPARPDPPSVPVAPPVPAEPNNVEISLSSQSPPVSVSAAVSKGGKEGWREEGKEGNDIAATRWAPPVSSVAATSSTFSTLSSSTSESDGRGSETRRTHAVPTRSSIADGGDCRTSREDELPAPWRVALLLVSAVAAAAADGGDEEGAADAGAVGSAGGARSAVGGFGGSGTLSAGRSRWRTELAPPPPPPPPPPPRHLQTEVMGANALDINHLGRPDDVKEEEEEEGSAIAADPICASGAVGDSVPEAPAVSSRAAPGEHQPPAACLPAYYTALHPANTIAMTRPHQPTQEPKQPPPQQQLPKQQQEQRSGALDVRINLGLAGGTAVPAAPAAAHAVPGGSSAAAEYQATPVVGGDCTDTATEPAAGAAVLAISAAESETAVRLAVTKPDTEVLALAAAAAPSAVTEAGAAAAAVAGSSSSPTAASVAAAVAAEAEARELRHAAVVPALLLMAGYGLRDDLSLSMAGWEAEGAGAKDMDPSALLPGVNLPAAGAVVPAGLGLTTAAPPPYQQQLQQLDRRLRLITLLPGGSTVEDVSYAAEGLTAAARFVSLAWGAVAARASRHAGCGHPGGSSWGGEAAEAAGLGHRDGALRGDDSSNGSGRLSPPPGTWGGVGVYGNGPYPDLLGAVGAGSSFNSATANAGSSIHSSSSSSNSSSSSSSTGGNGDSSVGSLRVTVSVVALTDSSAPTDPWVTGVLAAGQAGRLPRPGVSRWGPGGGGGGGGNFPTAQCDASGSGLITAPTAGGGNSASSAPLRSAASSAPQAVPSPPPYTTASELPVDIAPDCRARAVEHLAVRGTAVPTGGAATFAEVMRGEGLPAAPPAGMAGEEEMGMKGAAGRGAGAAAAAASSSSSSSEGAAAAAVTVLGAKSGCSPTVMAGATGAGRGDVGDWGAAPPRWWVPEWAAATEIEFEYLTIAPRGR